MLYILRLLFDFVCILFLRNGIKITSSGEEVLYISSSLFRYALYCDFLYFVIDIGATWLYEKGYKLMIRLFPIKKKGFDE